MGRARTDRTGRGEGDPRRYLRYLQSRPAAWEDAAIELLIRLAHETRCAVHVVHLSSAASLTQIRARQRRRAFASPSRPVLTISASRRESVPDGATEYKCAPPIREHKNREGLWRGLQEGVIDFVVSDHSPCTPALKGRERGDFAEAWGGVASLQLGLPAIWTEAQRRGRGLGEISTWMSARPAALAGLGRRKGQIAPGFDARPSWSGIPTWSSRSNPSSSTFGTRSHPTWAVVWSARVEATFLRGRLVYDGSGHPAGPVGMAILGRDTRGMSSTSNSPSATFSGLVDLAAAALGGRRARRQR